MAVAEHRDFMMIVALSQHRRRALLSAAKAAIGTAVLAVSLTGCAPGDVALEGKLFQTVGAAVGLGGPEKEAKVAPRAGLVLPPGLNNNLPTPGEYAVPDGQIADIRDFDSSKKVDRTKLAAAQKEYCRINYELPKARNDQTVDGVEGPAGPCRPSVLESLAQWNNGE